MTRSLPPTNAPTDPQCYLTDSAARLALDLERARREVRLGPADRALLSHA